MPVNFSGPEPSAEVVPWSEASKIKTEGKTGDSILIARLPRPIAEALDRHEPGAVEQVVVAGEEPGQYFLKAGIPHLVSNHGHILEVVPIRITRGEFREVPPPPDWPKGQAIDS